MHETEKNENLSSSEMVQIILGIIVRYVQRERKDTERRLTAYVAYKN